MTRDDIKNLKFRVYKEVKFKYGDYLERDVADPDEVLETLIGDLEYEFGRSLEDIDKDEVIDFILNNCIDEDSMEDLLIEYYPEFESLDK